MCSSDLFPSHDTNGHEQPLYPHELVKDFYLHNEVPTSIYRSITKEQTDLKTTTYDHALIGTLQQRSTFNKQTQEKRNKKPPHRSKTTMNQIWKINPVRNIRKHTSTGKKIQNTHRKISNPKHNVQQCKLTTIRCNKKSNTRKKK